jgi:hypothetical protein
MIKRVLIQSSGNDEMEKPSCPPNTAEKKSPLCPVWQWQSDNGFVAFADKVTEELEKAFQEHRQKVFPFDYFTVLPFYKGCHR